MADGGSEETLSALLASPSPEEGEKKGAKKKKKEEKAEQEKAALSTIVAPEMVIGLMALPFTWIAQYEKEPRWELSEKEGEVWGTAVWRYLLWKYPEVNLESPGIQLIITSGMILLPRVNLVLQRGKAELSGSEQDNHRPGEEGERENDVREELHSSTVGE
jgi:hypothetical protein